MWVTAEVSRTMTRLICFLLVLAFSTALLYLLSYENRARVANDTPSQVPSTKISASFPATSTPVSEPKAPAQPALKWKKTMTTYFYVGEPADESNAFITNTVSYWDERWQEHFGGVDSPSCRNGYLPCGFTPKENPFYFALPYAEYDEDGVLKASISKIPWYQKDSLPLLKNRWIAVRHQGHTCYAQWQDVGPNGEDDFAYVFGAGEPVNTFGVRAGLDVSPALWKCLQMPDNGYTEWAFVDFAEVPAGPWKDIVTTSGISWGG